MADLISALFNPEGLNLNNTETPVEAIKEFRPSYKKGGDSGKFEAVIRFLPNPENPKDLSIIQKWTVFLKNPLTDQGKTIDSPSTVGEPDPLTQMFFALRNSKNAQAAALQDNFKRHQNFYSLVQVIECPQDPSLTNKILIWKYGIKIYEKICQEKTPVMQGQAPRQPFDLFKGRPFKVVAVKQQNFNNLDQSFFFDIQYPANCMRLVVDNPQAPGQKQVVPATLEMAQTEQGRQLISNFLTENAPKLSEYMYHPWDEETKKYVDDMILLHGKILNGAPITALQQASMAGAMSVQQPMSAAQPSITPTVVDPTQIYAQQPQMPTSPMSGMQIPVTPAPAAPATPSLGTILSQPAAPAAPAPADPMMGLGNTAPQNPAASSIDPTASLGVGVPGLSVGTEMPGMQVPPAAPTAAINGIDMSSVDSILNSTSQPVAPQTAPGIGDLSAVLNSTIV